MKINYNISKNCLLTILLILPVLVHSQEQRFVKMTGSTGYNDGNWTCWREGIRYSHQTLVNGSNVFLQHPNGSYGAIVDVGSSIGFRVVYSKDGTAHFSSKISVPPTYGSASIPRKIRVLDACHVGQMVRYIIMMLMILNIFRTWFMVEEQLQVEISASPVLMLNYLK